jgi:MFS transporter, DHA1 family, tetracycline resistance protein
VLGPLIGGLLATIDTRAPFYAAAAMAAGNLIFGALVLPETVTEPTAAPSGWPAPIPWAPAGGHGCHNCAAPLLAFLILGIAMNVYPAIWAYFGQARFGWSSTMVGISLAIYGISFAHRSGGAGRPADPPLRRTHARPLWHVGRCRHPGGAWLCHLGHAGPDDHPITALGRRRYPRAAGHRQSRDTSPDAQGELQGVLASLNAIAMITSPLIMTSTFAAFTAPGAPVYAPGAPFLLACLP